MMLSLTRRAGILAALVALTLHAPHALAQAEPDIAVTPTAIDFGEVIRGSDIEEVVTVTNEGEAPLLIEDVRVGPGTCCIGYSGGRNPIGPGGSREFTLFIRPGEGPYENSFTIETNDPDEPVVVVPITGTGVENTGPDPDLAVTPAAVDFGNVPLGSSGGALLLLENQGGSVLTVSRVTTEAPFSVEERDAGPFEVQPGRSESVGLDFDPPKAGTFTGELVIESDDPDTPVLRVPLTGTGFVQGAVTVVAEAEAVGRELTLAATITNGSAIEREFDVWALIDTPDGRDLFRGPLRVAVPGDGVAMPVVIRTIEDRRPAGTYEVLVRVGTYRPGPVVEAEDATSFVLPPAAMRAPASAAAGAPTTTLAVYPNPFNPSTEVRFDLDAPADVTLEVFDALGRRVVVLADGPMAAGPHARSFDAAGLASGLYLARLRVGDTVTVRRLTLLK